MKLYLQNLIHFCFYSRSCFSFLLFCCSSSYLISSCPSILPFLLWLSYWRWSRTARTPQLSSSDLYIRFWWCRCSSLHHFLTYGLPAQSLPQFLFRRTVWLAKLCDSSLTVGGESLAASQVPLRVFISWCHGANLIGSLDIQRYWRILFATRVCSGGHLNKFTIYCHFLSSKRQSPPSQTGGSLSSKNTRRGKQYLRQQRGKGK